MGTNQVNYASVGPIVYDNSLWYALNTDGQLYVGSAPTIDQNVVRLVDLISYDKKYSVGFISVTSVTILGSVHLLSTIDLSVDIWDTSNPHNKIEAGSITVADITFDVVVSFAVAQSGRITLRG
jgi:hypothetical protein